MVTFLRPTVGANGWSIGKPCGSRMIVAMGLELEDFGIRPRAHGERFAAMRNSLMRGLAFIAYKGKVLDTDCPETKLFLGATVGTNCVARQTS